MHCRGCVARIETLLKGTHGVHKASVSFADGLARVRYNPHTLTEDELVEVVRKGGFSAEARRL